jgi:hypothetical protein
MKGTPYLQEWVEGYNHWFRYRLALGPEGRMGLVRGAGLQHHGHRSH